MPDEPGRAASPAPSVGQATKVPRGSLLGNGRPASPSVAAPKRCRASLPHHRGEPVQLSPVAASPSEPGLAAWRLSTAGGPEPAGASSGALPEGCPALTVCRHPKPSAAQSSRWGGVGRGGEAAIESVASGGVEQLQVIPHGVLQRYPFGGRNVIFTQLNHNCIREAELKNGGPQPEE
uniref:Uncharacterized protein n=1 Tax=Sphaerodactylus townsendi TaxID=933632 RepID=A0ACB8EQV3_9SAUR